MLTHLKLAARRLRKTPGFTITALATLAICVGTNLAIFAVVDAIIVRSLPFPAADRLIAVHDSFPRASADHIGLSGASIPNYFDRRRAIKAFASVSIFKESSVLVGDAGSPRRVTMARVSPEFFTTLEVPLAVGRTFTEAELSPSTDNVAILTNGFWRSHFNADPDVIGRTFVNDGIPTTVIGVLPRDFHYLSSTAQFYRPASSSPADRRLIHRHSTSWDMIARLAPGATIAEAQAQIDAFNARQATDDPLAQIMKSTGYHTIVTGLHDDQVRTVKPMLVLLECGVLFLLLIGGVNLANLLLVRASGRSKEFAVRQALGARRRDVVLDVLMETTLLSLGGGFCGLLLSVFGIGLIRALGTDKLPLGVSVAFDGRVAIAALAAAIVVGLLLAVPTIWLNLRTKVAFGLQSESRTGTAGRGAQRLRHVFVVVQVAMAFVLLSGAGLLSVSLKHVLEAPVGFNPDHILTGNIVLPPSNYKETASRLAFVERLLPAIRALPGVTDVAINSGLPFNRTIMGTAVAVEGFASPGSGFRAHYLSSVTSDYWQTVGIPLLQGRLLEDADNHRKPGVCVVDQAFAEHYWPGANPLGHRLDADTSVFNKNDALTLTVVGVVGNVKQDDLAESTDQGSVYSPYAFYSPNLFSLVVRTVQPLDSMTSMVRKVILQLDPGLAIDDLRPMQANIDDSLVARRSPAILAGIFAAVALLLAAIGTYGVLSYAVSQRRREIGVRMALGAQPQQIRNQFLSIGLRLLAGGIILGVIGAWCAGRAMQSVLFNVPAMQGGTLAFTVVIMSIVALSASLLPAHRAAKVDPMTALRAE